MPISPFASVLISLQSLNVYVLSVNLKLCSRIVLTGVPIFPISSSQAFSNYGAIALLAIDAIWKLFLCRLCVMHLLDINAFSRLAGGESMESREEKLAWYIVGGTKSPCVEEK